jgi:hypothetical protein
MTVNNKNDVGVEKVRGRSVRPKRCCHCWSSSARSVFRSISSVLGMDERFALDDTEGGSMGDTCIRKAPGGR